METQVTTRRDLETALIEKCWKDPEFKKQVIEHPKAMLERHIGQKLSPALTIVIHEEDAKTVHFSIPPAPSNLTELSDDELEQVAGGTDLFVTAMVSLSIGASVSAVGTGAGMSALITLDRGW